MKLASRIFRRDDWYVTSEFGTRSPINTSAGVTSSFHSGCDYGTNGQKWNQYALEDGSVLSCGIASDGAKYVWVKYPRLNIKLLHYHLDSIKVSKGQKVNYNTVLGTTGKTGKATGIHLHLGLKYLNDDKYVDPHKYNYEEAKETTSNTNTTLKYKVGNVVSINGVYISSTSNEKLKPAKTTGKITKILKGKKNPYLLENGNIGWVNDSCIISCEKVNNEVYHTVKKGENLWTIAKRYYGNGMKYPEIKRLNNLKSDTIYPNQKLRIK